jgi:hypothetical protein
MAADQLRSLGYKVDEMQRQEVGLVDDLVQSKQFRLVEVGPVKDVDHLRNDRASEIARRCQLEATAVRCFAQQVQRISSDRGFIEFVDSQVTGKTQSCVRR